MTKGKALIEARKALGPAAHVRFDSPLNGKVQCIVERQLGSADFTGDSWDECLKQSESTQPAAS